MSEYLSGRKRNLNIGIRSYTENDLVLDVIGNTNITGVTSLASAGGITTTGGDLYVGGDVNVSGVITAISFIGNFIGSIDTAINVVGGIGSLSSLVVSGVSTLGVISSTNLTSQNLNVSGITTVGFLTASNIRVSGIVTAPTFVGNLTGIASTATKLETTRTFQITGDIVAPPQNFDGTANVSFASSIQPNTVGLGTHTYGDYVKNITGTTGEIEVSVTSGEGVSPQIGLPDNVTISDSLRVVKDVQIDRNLNVTGNITIGGTSAYLSVENLVVKDRDIIIGFLTDAYGNDASTDISANTGGIAIASTEGSPLVNLNVVGFETLPPTYKKIMWFKANTFAGLNTDAWMFNYGVGIGSTQIPNGVRLAVGGVQVTDSDIIKIRNINASGIITATTFVGNLTGTATTAINVIGGIGSLSSLSVSGITTVGFLTASNISVSGVVTATTFYGNLTGGTADIATYATSSGIATYSTSSGIATYATSAGISTNVIGGIASVTSLSVSGISTLGTVKVSSGIVTATSGIVTYYGDGSKLTGVSGFNIVTQEILTNPVYLTFVENIGVSSIGISTNKLTFIPSSGNLGIGTTNATSRLSVVGDGLFTGVVTATSFSGTATIATNVVGGIGSVSSLRVTGFSTLSNISVASSIFDSTNSSGVSQYVLTSTPSGVLWQSVSGVGAITGINVGSSSVDSSFNIGFFNINSGTTANAFVAPSHLTYNPSRTFVGIGTTNPTSKLTISSALRSQALGIGSEFIVSDTGSFVPSVSIAATIGSGTTEKVLLRSISRNQGTLDVVSNYRQNQMMNVSDTNSEGVFRVTALETSTVAFVAPIYRQLLVVGESGIVTTRNAVAIATANATGASGTVGADIYGNVNIRSPFSTSTSYVAIAPNFRDNGALSFEAPIGAASTNSVTQLFSITNNVSSSIFRINDLNRNPILEANIAGNIGIGTTLPFAKLDVALTSQFRGRVAFAQTGNPNNNSAIDLIPASSGLSTTGFGTYVPSGGALVMTENRGNTSTKGAGNSSQIFTVENNNSSLFRVNTVGIGVSTVANPFSIYPILDITGSGDVRIFDTETRKILTNAPGFSSTTPGDGDLLRIDSYVTPFIGSFPTVRKALLMNKFGDMEFYRNIITNITLTKDLYVLNQGVGIGTTNIDSTKNVKLQVVGNARITSIGATALGQIDISHLSSSTLSPSGISTSGIYSGSPSRGSVIFSGIPETNLNGGQLVTITNDNASSIFTVNRFIPGLAGLSTVGPSHIRAIETVVNVTSGGNVGIGTSIPSSRLDVRGNVFITGITTLGITTATNLTSQNLNSQNLNVSGISTFSNGPVLIGAATSTGTASQRLQVTGGAYVSGSIGIGTTNPIQPFQVGAAGTNVVVIDSIGEIGIGTTNPQQKLHVLGNVLVAAGSSTDQYITLKPYELSNGTLSWEGSAGKLLSITNNLTSGSIFSVCDSSGIPSIDVDASGIIAIGPYGGSLSNVGIGTTNPTSKLHVVGNALITGISTVGLGSTSSPSVNSTMSFELTNNTTLTVRVRGTDGTIRTGIVALS